MEIKIYIDVLLLINFVFDYLLLWITGSILKLPSKSGQLFFAALPGAVYAVFAFFLPASFFCMPVKIVIGAIMVLVAFHPGRFRIFLRELCVFYVVTLMYGGAAFAFFTISDTASALGAVYKNGCVYLPLPVTLLLSLALLCYFVLKIAYRCGTRLSARSKNIISLSILYRGKRLPLRGFYDSGNLLREPASGKGVIVAEWTWAKPLFPHRKSPEDAEKDGLIPIPYRTVLGEALLYAFLPEAIYITQGKKHVLTEAVYIGLLDRTLDYYHNWDAILPHDFEGENYNETKHHPKTNRNVHPAKAKDFEMAIL